MASTWDHAEPGAWLITSLTDQALASLDSVDLQPPARDVLTGLAYAATRRSV
jgi:hypothetical protein